MRDTNGRWTLPRIGAAIRRRAMGLFDRSPEPSLSPGQAKNQQYDREAVEVMRRCMDADAIGIDGGAHRGEFLRAMCAIAPAGRHLAFEPLPHLAESLERAFPGIRVNRSALGDRAGTAEFVHVVNDPAYSGLERREYDRPDPQIETLVVDVVRLDDVLEDGDRPAFIKLDLEGGEYHALLGAVDTLRRCRPVVVFEAGKRSTGHYGVTPDMIHALFTERLGYGLTTMRRWLDGRRSLDRKAFANAYETEFYFLGDPGGRG